MAQQHELPGQLVSKKPEGARPILHSDMGWQYQHAEWCGRLEEAGIVQSMSRKGSCIDNGATEQVFGHLKDEFFRNRVWPSFDAFKRDLDAYVHPLEHEKAASQTKGTDTGGVPESVPMCGLGRFICPSKFWGAVQSGPCRPLSYRPSVREAAIALPAAVLQFGMQLTR
jgi:hypothetical protein